MYLLVLPVNVIVSIHQSYIQNRTRNARLKQVGKNFMLVVDRIKNMQDVLFFLEGMVRKDYSGK